MDYWILRKQDLALKGLYLEDGAYTYRKGWNGKAVAATAAGCAAAWIGLLVPALRPLYDYAWFMGLGVSSLVYYLLMK